MSNSVLLTGGLGYLGGRLACSLVASGFEVRCGTRRCSMAPPDWLPAMSIAELDWSSIDSLTDACRGVDQVIHLAARAGVRPSLLEPALYQRVNVEGTVNLLEAGRTCGVKKFTLASSSSVYGTNAKVPFAESDPVFQPISPYAASKMACESLGHVYHQVYGFDIAMLRFFTVYGPRQRPDLAIHKFAGLISAGLPIPVFGDGSTERDYTYSDDIVAGVMACTRREFGFEVFNLGESQTVRLDHLITLLETSLGKRAVIERHPAQPGDVPRTFADITKARAWLGYDPQTRIAEGIPRFVDWFRSADRAA